MKAQVFLQSELLTDIEVLEIDRNAGHAALYEACLARLGNPQTEEFFLFVEDNDEERPFEKMPEIPNGLRVHLHRLKGIDGVVAVRPDFKRRLLTDAGPQWIGADSVWNGTVQGSNIRTKGEGVVVGEGGRRRGCVGEARHAAAEGSESAAEPVPAR